MSRRGEKASPCLFSFFYEVEDRVEEEKVFTSFQQMVDTYLQMLDKQRESGFKYFHKLRFCLLKETHIVGKDWWNYREYRGRTYHREIYTISNRKVERY